MSRMYAGYAEIQHPSVMTIALTAAALIANDNKVDLDLPDGAIITRAQVAVHALFAGTTTTAKLGDAVEDDRYGTAALNTVGIKALTPTGFKHGGDAATKGKPLTLSGVAGLTAGDATLIIEYIVPGRGGHYTTGNASAPSAPPRPGPALT